MSNSGAPRGMVTGGAVPSVWAASLELDGYEDLSVVGRGGFGVVYRARQGAFDRTVAIKVLSAWAMDDAAQSRFQRECRAMGAVSGHPNIVTVYGSGFDAAGHPYLVMDYMAGGSLAERVQRDGAMPWPEVLEAGVKLAGALEAAHKAGILHRDVKPENVLMSTYGEPTLADFGISRVHGGYETRSGAMTASPLHAAPEVLSGGTATVASDVYSLGSTLFSLVAGAAAFQGGDADNLFGLILRVADEPVPDLRGRGVPDELCRVIEAAMAKHPDLRPSTAADLGRALQDAQRALGRAVTELRAGREDADKTVNVHQADAVARPPVRQPVEPVVAPSPRRGHRGLLIGLPLVAMVVVALVVGLLAAVRPGPEPADASVSMDLPAARTAKGLSITRQWKLDGAKGDAFRASVKLANATARPLTADYDEVVPKSLAASVEAITFSPMPDSIVQRDPIVRYRLTLAPYEARTIGYAIRVPAKGTDRSRLSRWADDRATAQKAYDDARQKQAVAARRPVTKAKAVAPAPSAKPQVQVPPSAVVPPARSSSSAASSSRSAPSGPSSSSIVVGPPPQVSPRSTVVLNRRPARTSPTTPVTTPKPAPPANRPVVKNPRYSATDSYNLSGVFGWWDIWLRPDAFIDPDGDAWAYHSVANGKYGKLSIVPCSQDRAHGCLRYTPTYSVTYRYSDTFQYRVYDPRGTRQPTAWVSFTVCVHC